MCEIYKRNILSTIILLFLMYHSFIHSFILHFDFLVAFYAATFMAHDGSCENLGGHAEHLFLVFAFLVILKSYA